MAITAILRSKLPKFLPQLIKLKITIITNSVISPNLPQISRKTHFSPTQLVHYYHDGRPRGSLWRGKKLIGKEAIFVILGLKRFRDDDEKLNKFVKTHVWRLLKMDMVAVLNELERQEEVALAVKVFDFFSVASVGILWFVMIYFLCSAINDTFRFIESNGSVY